MYGWRAKFLGGIVDDAVVDLPKDEFPCPLAYVFPCYGDCCIEHAQVEAHLTFDVDWAVQFPEVVVYRRQALDSSQMIAVYRLGDFSPRSEVGQDALISA